MNLQGSIVEHQNALFQFYQKLENRFSENRILQVLWNDMSQDISLQIQGIKALPPALWNQIRKTPDSRLDAAIGEFRSPAADIEKITMRGSLELALQYEEPIMLGIYARIIRNLRKDQTDSALDFYILVKSHATRIVRTMESLAGDPALIQQARLLLQGLEKEVQEPSEEIKSAKPSAGAKPKKAAVAASPKAQSVKQQPPPPPPPEKAKTKKSASPKA